MNSQKSVKIKLSLIVALALAFLISVGAFLGVTLARADRSVTISGTSIFVTTSNAAVWAHKETKTETVDEEEKEVDHFYTMFAFTADEDSVNFRKNLAYKWVENTEKTEVEEDADGNEIDTAVSFKKQDGWFNMELGFADENNKGENGDENSLQFEHFVITFESQEYSQTKDGKSVNYLVFAPAESGKVSVYVVHKDVADKDLDAVLGRLSDDELLGEVDNDHIAVKFTEYKDGNYTVQVNELAKTGKFENVGKTYAKYSSSTTTPVTPLSFKALFAEEEEDGDIEAHGNAFMTLYNMNGQSMEFTNTVETGKKITNGQVNDTTPPVLCLDKEVPFIQYNGEIAFDYTVIDVLTSSPSLTTSYYMLTTADVNKTPEYKTASGGDYKEVSDSDDQYMFPHAKHYKPTANDYNADVYNQDEVKAAVKVVLKLTDTTSTGGQTTYVLLDWFVNEKYLLLIGEEGAKVPYVAVATDNQGVAFAYTDLKTKTSDPENSAAWNKAVTDYKAAVAEAAKDLKAGSKNYFYLPSVENLLADNATAYSDLTFSIYYNNGSQQSSTNKNANALSINLTKAGKYIFTIYARDAAGNGVFYYDGGEETEIETGDIWNMYKQEEDGEFAGMRKYLPWFEFTVEESEISIEDPDEQSTAYVDSSYTPDSFEINGVSVNTTYTLYEFQNNLWAQEHDGVALTYEKFKADVETLLQENRKYFTRIRPASELKEGTADYDKFNDYAWNGSSLSFTPQTANAFYIIKCEASSSETAEPVSKIMTIAAAPKVAPIKGEDTWVQDNVTSIILLCIAGASLIGIILLLVIKPKNKGDLDEVIETKPKKKSK